MSDETRQQAFNRRRRQEMVLRRTPAWQAQFIAQKAPGGLPPVRSASQPLDVPEAEPVEPRGRRWSWQKRDEKQPAAPRGLPGRRRLMDR